VNCPIKTPIRRRLGRILLASGRVAVAILAVLAPSEAGDSPGAPGPAIAPAFAPPPEYAGDLGPYRSPLIFEDGRTVRGPAEWPERRREIFQVWHDAMGPWPAPIEHPRAERSEAERREGHTERRIKLEVAPDRTTEGYLLVPDGKGPFPAVLVVFYEPDTAIGRGVKPGRDFARQLVRRGFACLSIGFDPRVIDPAKSGITLQPLAYLAYAASNAYTAMAAMPEVDPARVAVMGHSYGGKWAMFAACLDERFACGVWSDPGVAFDEARANVNYWEPWYLGWEPGRTRKPGLITKANPRLGAYKSLVEGGHDLHELQSLMAPRPFLVSGGSEDSPARWRALNHVVGVNNLLGRKGRVAMTNRPDHDPTGESNEAIGQFLDFALKPSKPAGRP